MARTIETPFVPGQMNHKAQVRALLPGATDAFVAGAWLVRQQCYKIMAEVCRPSELKYCNHSLRLSLQQIYECAP